MRLRIALPPTPGVHVDVGHLVDHIPDEDARVRHMLSFELGGHTLRMGGTVLEHTTTGWPLELTLALVLEDERTVEQRLLALYRFAEWRGHVLVRGRDEAAWTAALPALRAALFTAAPDFRGDGEVYCLAHLFE